MRIRPLMRLTVQRFRPSSWGALPLFLLLLLPIRWVLGGPVLPWHWHALPGGGGHAAGLLPADPPALAVDGRRPAPALPAPGGRPGPALERALAGALRRRCTHWIGGPEPPRVADAIHGFALRSNVPLPVFRVIVQLPFACLVGWFMAEMEARGLDNAEAHGRPEGAGAPRPGSRGPVPARPAGSPCALQRPGRPVGTGPGEPGGHGGSPAGLLRSLPPADRAAGAALHSRWERNGSCWSAIWPSRPCAWARG